MAMPDFVFKDYGDLVVEDSVSNGIITGESSDSFGDGELRPSAHIYGTTKWTWDVSAQAYADCWFAFYFDIVNGTTASGTTPIFEVNGATHGLCRLMPGSVANTSISFQYWNGSSWVEIDEITGIVLTNCYRFDVHVSLANSGGTFALYQEGSLISEFTGDTILDTDTTVDAIRFSSGHNTTSQRNEFSPVCVDGADTRDFFTFFDSYASGYTPLHSEASGTYPTSIDEVYWSPNDGDFLTWDAAGERQDISIQNINVAVSDSWVIETVYFVARGRSVYAPGFVMEAYSAVGGTLYTENAQDSFSGGVVENLFFEFPNDPTTGLPWANKSAVNAQTLGLRSLTPP